MPQKLLFTKNEETAKAEIARNGGRVIHQFGPGVMVAELPDEVNAETLSACSSQPTQPMDEGTELAVHAWTSGRAAKEAGLESAPAATEGLAWDTPGYQPPHEFGPEETAALALEDGEVPAESTGTPTSLYLVGSVAVGVVLVSRNTGPEAMSSAERTQIVQEVQEGLNWLATVEPRANVSFVYDIRPITIATAPGPYAGVSESYEKYERDWRDAALASMGYAGGRAGYRKYAQDLGATKGTDWAYVVFFTKYPLHHFAYAVYEKIVMSYDNDGWGSHQINRVFAHETCHIFGALDEYGNCSCNSTSGHLAGKNGNCVHCFPPGAQMPCLMNRNTLEMCDFSRKQIGWHPSLFPQPAAPLT